MNIFTIPGQGYDSNVYILTGEKATIIDTGTGLNHKEMIKKIQKHIDLDIIEQIILTHEHYDHVGGTPNILQKSQKKIHVFAHKDASDKLQSGKSEFAVLLGGTMPKITIDTLLQGGEELLLGDELFTVFATPGHSLGGICLYSKKRKTLFSGDIVFAHGGFGRYDFPGGDSIKLLQSIKHLTTLDVVELYTGHGEIVLEQGLHHINHAFHSISMMV